MLPYDKLQRGFANKQTTRNLRFSWCFSVKKGAKTFPRKLNGNTLANCVDKYRFRLKQWSRSYQVSRSIWILEISKMKLQKNELKRCQKRTLIKVLKTRKVSIKQVNSICTTYLAFCYRNAKFWAEFGYGKYLIVPFWYASAAYQARFVSPWVFWLDCVSPKYEPWLDQTRLICLRSVLKRYG